MKTLNKIQKELKAPKSQKNTFQHYNYRSCEDILEAVKPLLGNAIVLLSDEIWMVGDRFYVKATATITEDKESISVTAYARESEEKFNKEGKPMMDHAQITGATSSYARKYALNGLFCIDDTRDADTEDNTHEKPVAKVKNLAPEKEVDARSPFEKACDAILSATEPEVLAKLSEQITASKKLTNEEKAELHDTLQARSELV